MHVWKRLIINVINGDLNMDLSLPKYHTALSPKTIKTGTSMLSDAEREILLTAHNKEWTNPKFKVRWFIGEANYTPYGKLKQWLMEAKSREQTIESVETDHNRKAVELKIVNRNIENETDELKKELLMIDAFEIKKNMDGMNNKIADIYKERKEILELITDFLASEEGKTPDGRSLMDVVNTPEEEMYEAQYWTVRLARQAAMDMVAYGRIGAGNYEAIQQLHPNQQVEVLGLANHISLTLDKRQEAIRQEIGKHLGFAPPDQGYLGSIDPKLLNSVIEAGNANMVSSLAASNPDNPYKENVPPQESVPEVGNAFFSIKSEPVIQQENGINNVYNL
jgi:hypothetical protein